jgi:hypothetical protein
MLLSVLRIDASRRNTGRPGIVAHCQNARITNYIAITTTRMTPYVTPHDRSCLEEHVTLVFGKDLPSGAKHQVRGVAG